MWELNTNGKCLPFPKSTWLEDEKEREEPRASREGTHGAKVSIGLVMEWGS
jgi:hypothetical protein